MIEASSPCAIDFGWIFLRFRLSTLFIPESKSGGSKVTLTRQVEMKQAIHSTPREGMLESDGKISSPGNSHGKMVRRQVEWRGRIPRPVFPFGKTKKLPNSAKPSTMRSGIPVFFFDKSNPGLLNKVSLRRRQDLVNGAENIINWVNIVKVIFSESMIWWTILPIDWEFFWIFLAWNRAISPRISLYAKQ